MTEIVFITPASGLGLQHTSDGSGQMQAHSERLSRGGWVSAVYQPLYQQPRPRGEPSALHSRLPDIFLEFKAQVRLVLTFWISWLTGRPASFYTL